MKIIKPSYKIINPTSHEQGVAILKNIEDVARTCYQSSDKITDDSYMKITKMLRDNKHDAMLEFGSMTVRFVCSRSVTHELVRHRLASFSQLSQRYVKQNDLEVICPKEIQQDEDAFNAWVTSIHVAEKAYNDLLNMKVIPGIARAVLPNCTMTEINVSANLREWRHIFELRTSKAAYSEIRELMIPLLEDAKQIIPIVFDDITY